MKKIIPLIKDIREIKTKGPWKTKSDGDLTIFKNSLNTIPEK